MASHVSTLPYAVHTPGGSAFSVYKPSADGYAAALRDARWHRVHSVASEDDEVEVTYRDDGHWLVTLVDHREEACHHLAAPTEAQRRKAAEAAAA